MGRESWERGRVDVLTLDDPPAKMEAVGSQLGKLKTNKPENTNYFIKLIEYHCDSCYKLHKLHKSIKSIPF